MIYFHAQFVPCPYQPWVKECRTNNLPLGIAFCPHFLCVWTFGEWFFSFGAVIKTEFWRAESNIGSCLSLTLLLSSHIVRKEKLRLKILISVPLVEGINWHPSIIYRLNTTTLMVPWNSCSLVFLVLQEMAGGPFNLPCHFLALLAFINKYGKKQLKPCLAIRLNKHFMPSQLKNQGYHALYNLKHIIPWKHLSGGYRVVNWFIGKKAIKGEYEWHSDRKI